ncbi:hypothetical protein F8388_016010 [Cannabis sativa]|uniref:DUF4283 domain-containing protein n=1 Tax=Cannabis sativa TaxID=3483 RepID=A0A7J6FXL9_CANSA|nr:hypothetical protein F8388_016010 [Cannabis sativa]
MADKRQILEQGPWCIKGELIVFLSWSTRFGLKELSFYSVGLWIQLHNLSHDYFSRCNANVLGAKASRVVCIDLDESKPFLWKIWIWIQVEFEVTKPLFNVGRWKLLLGEVQIRKDWQLLLLVQSFGPSLKWWLLRNQESSSLAIVSGSQVGTGEDASSYRTQSSNLKTRLIAMSLSYFSRDRVWVSKRSTVESRCAAEGVDGFCMLTSRTHLKVRKRHVLFPNEGECLTSTKSCGFMSNSNKVGDVAPTIPKCDICRTEIPLEQGIIIG